MTRRSGGAGAPGNGTSRAPGNSAGVYSGSFADRRVMFERGRRSFFGHHRG